MTSDARQAWRRQQHYLIKYQKSGSEEVAWPPDPPGDITGGSSSKFRTNKPGMAIRDRKKEVIWQDQTQRETWEARSSARETTAWFPRGFSCGPNTATAPLVCTTPASSSHGWHRGRRIEFEFQLLHPRQTMNTVTSNSYGNSEQADNNIRKMTRKQSMGCIYTYKVKQTTSGLFVRLFAWRHDSRPCSDD